MNIYPSQLLERNLYFSTSFVFFSLKSNIKNCIARILHIVCIIQYVSRAVCHVSFSFILIVWRKVTFDASATILV